jgi:hypothetical protein
MLKQAETHSQSPEELLRHLELETMRKRSLREASDHQRMGMIGGGLLLVIGGALVALYFLFSTLREMPHSSKDAPTGENSVPAGAR